MRPNDGPRRGFTAVEVLVVIAIIGVLVALILPAVQKVREASSRAQCLDHLRQVGLALHGYHQPNGQLPPGVSYDAYPYRYMSWHTRLLPFIEQEALWRQAVEDYAADPIPFNPPYHRDMSVILQLYACPSTAETLRTGTWEGMPVALTAYLGVEGVNLKRKDGVLFANSGVRFADVTDGTSNTLMVGERPPSPDDYWGWWYAGAGQFYVGPSGSVLAGSMDMVLGMQEKNYRVWPDVVDCPAGPYGYGPGKIGNICDVFHFWSRHPGGANFLFADGSARFISYGDSSVMAALSTRAGGEAASLPD
jgi:prepilin-type N-terminal cleavage/methylation domain-containing protein/prepilin-type processing-associated H-X9-DG protein